MILLKFSCKMIECEGVKMLELVIVLWLDGYLKVVGYVLIFSWIIVGMNNVIDNFFDSLKVDMVELVVK